MQEKYVELPFSFDILKRQMGEAVLKCGQVFHTLSFGKPTVSEVDLALAILYEVQTIIERIAKDLKAAIQGYIKE